MSKKDVTHSLVLAITVDVDEMNDAQVELLVDALRKTINNARTDAKNGTFKDGVRVTQHGQTKGH